MTAWETKTATDSDDNNKKSVKFPTETDTKLHSQTKCQSRFKRMYEEMSSLLLLDVWFACGIKLYIIIVNFLELQPRHFCRHQ